MAFRAVDRNKIYVSIVDQIVEGIRAGTFQPGAVLPAERLLAEQFGVSRTSVREAIRVLEHAGVLDVRTGSGTYVSDGALSSSSLLRTRAALEGDESPLDLIVARRGIEPLCAELAATQRNRRDLAALRRAFENHRAVVEAEGDPRQADIAFHLAIAEASHNTVLELLMRQLAGIMRQHTWQEFTDRSRQKPGRPRLNVEHHKAIVDAIDAKEPLRARETMNAHLSDVEESVLIEATNRRPGRG
jgi:GntR family transcriptional repressor for pyruvate dehydrogenase complex